MDKKRELVAALFFCILIIGIFAFSLSIVSAAEDEEEADETEVDSVSQTGYDLAYTCLEKTVEQKGYSNLDNKEQAYALLALAYDSEIQGKLKTALYSNSNGNKCWPKGDCNAKDTAIALIALNRIQQTTDAVENWMIGEAEISDDVEWYLQIDAESKTDCELKHGSGSADITLNEDKKIIGSGGSCFTKALDGYWLKIDSDCYGDAITISCDKDFKTALAYKKSGSSNQPYYISSITHQAKANSETEETANLLCFESSRGQCDYEATLWAALAFKITGKDISAYLPYLITLSSSNSQYFPSAFLYMMGQDEYIQEIINNQDTEGYWQVSSDASKRDFQTALAALALESTTGGEALSSAESYLAESQLESGCWSDITDTSFILYSIARKSPSLTSASPGCERSGYFCVSSEQTCEDAAGTVKDNYDCDSISTSACCTLNIEEDIPNPDDKKYLNDCEDRYFSCRDICFSTEQSEPYSCGAGDSRYCCSPASETPETSTKSNYWWVWLLIILIILLGLAIVFRNQLKIWLFRMKNKFSKGSVSPQSRPGFPPSPGAGLGASRQMPRRILPFQQRPMPGMRRPMPGSKPPQFPKENMLQETIRKLKEMGK